MIFRTVSIDSLNSDKLYSYYLTLTHFAAMMRQWGFLNFKKCLKHGAGEGIRTLDFHLGNSGISSLSKITRNDFSLLNKEITSFFGFFPYNQFYPFLTMRAAMVRQWKSVEKYYGNIGESYCQK
jgi:hypothetical protein